MMNDREKTSVVLAVDIGATNLRVALVDMHGSVCKKHTNSTPKKGDHGDELTDFVVMCISSLLDDMDTRECETYKIVSIGVSVAGPLLSDQKSYKPTNIHFGLVDIATPLIKKYALPVVLLNDTKAAVYAEWKIGKGRTFGGAYAAQNMCYITLSTGIGAGMILDGQLALGRDGSFGHVGQVSVNSPVCYGDHDWESYVGGINIAGFFAKWSAEKCQDASVYASATALFAAVEADSNVQEFMQIIKRINGQGLSNVIHAYNPELIVLGGSVAQHNWDLLTDGLHKHIRKDLIEVLPEIVLTDLGDDISCQGVALYAFDQLGLTSP